MLQIFYTNKNPKIYFSRIWNSNDSHRSSKWTFSRPNLHVKPIRVNHLLILYIQSWQCVTPRTHWCWRSKGPTTVIWQWDKTSWKLFLWTLDIMKSSYHILGSEIIWGRILIDWNNLIERRDMQIFIADKNMNYVLPSSST